MDINLLLTELKNIKNGDNIRFHLAKYDGSTDPLNAILDDDEWRSWQEYNQDKRNRFADHVQYIVTFAQYSSNQFLFGGIYEVSGKKENKYVVKKTTLNRELDKRLVIEYTGGNKRDGVYKAETLINSSKISEVLKEEYKGYSFPGMENINHSFFELEPIFRKQIKEWELPLSNSKGIYLLLDIKTNKKYIGSASGNRGFWGRWTEYIDNSHGGNKKLFDLWKIDDQYFKANFKFSILEVVASNFSTEAIEAKESKWKEKLNSRGEFGYNSN